VNLVAVERNKAASHKFRTGFAQMAFIRGTSRRDNLWGTADSDLIDGLEGDDSILGFGGHDTLTGGKGADQLFGADGNDTFIFDIDDLMIDGGADVDTMVLDEQNTGPVAGLVVTLSPMTGAVSYNGHTIPIVSIENFFSGSGKDNITGSSVANHIRGGGGNDKISGAGGNDLLNGESGNDIIDGGTGNDTIWGGIGNDTLNGGDNNDDLNGNEDNDKIMGGNGDDTIDTGPGINIADGGAGVDTIRYNYIGELDLEGGNTTEPTLIVDLMNGKARLVNSPIVLDDRLSNIENVIGSRIDDIITGNDGANVLSGDWGQDRLFGRNGNDTLRGGDGSDYLNGGQGSDFLWGDSGADTFVFEPSNTRDRDTIRDFEDSIDVIDLSAYHIQFQNLLITDSGADALIRVGNQITIELDNVHAWQLTPSDFIF
jgi:Ca2+-binding RTX toxin-like protein